MMGEIVFGQPSPIPIADGSRLPPATGRRSELFHRRHRNGAAELGFQRAEVVEGGDPLAEVGGNLAEADLQRLYDRLAGLSQLA